MQKTADWRAFFEEAGRRGGLARAQALTPERRREIAIRAARARYGLCLDCGAKPKDCDCKGEVA